MRTVSDSDTLQEGTETVPPPPTALAQTEYSAFNRFFIMAEDEERDGGRDREVDLERLKSLKSCTSSADAEQELTFQKKRKQELSVMMAHIRSVVTAPFLT